MQALNAEREAARKVQAEAGLQNELKLISAMDPAITTMQDLMEMEGADKYFDLVKRGNTLTDAFKLLNFDKLATKRAEAAKQAALNRQAGKGHLTQTTGKGEGLREVPPEEAELYRDLMPGASEREIREEYNRYLRETKKG